MSHLPWAMLPALTSPSEGRLSLPSEAPDPTTGLKPFQPAHTPHPSTAPPHSFSGALLPMWTPPPGNPALSLPPPPLLFPTPGAVPTPRGPSLQARGLRGTLWAQGWTMEKMRKCLLRIRLRCLMLGPCLGAAFRDPGRCSHTHRTVVLGSLQLALHAHHRSAVRSHLHWQHPPGQPTPSLKAGIYACT